MKFKRYLQTKDKLGDNDLFRRGVYGSADIIFLKIRKRNCHSDKFILISSSDSNRKIKIKKINENHCLDKN